MFDNCQGRELAFATLPLPISTLHGSGFYALCLRCRSGSSVYLYPLQQLSSREKGKARIVLFPLMKTSHSHSCAESDKKSLQLNILSRWQVPKQKNKSMNRANITRKFSNLTVFVGEAGGKNQTWT